MYAIETYGLSKCYGAKTAVDRLDLRVRKGELMTLLGVNGAGKSSAIRMLATLSVPTSGDAVIEGFSLTQEAGRIREVLALSPQESSLAPNLTVAENLSLMTGLHGFSREKTARKLAEMKAIFGFEPFWNARAQTLSGGWQRRLSIAMALITEPRVLCLDEPTLGLDVLARRELWDTIRSLKGEVTILLTTHLMPEAQALSDRVAVIHGGRLLACDTVEALCRKYHTNDLEEAFLAVIGEGQA